MKIFAMAAAGLIALTGLAPGVAAPAAAQHRVVVERTVVRHDDGPRFRHRDRVRTRTVCRREWRRGHPVRICRQVRR